MNKGTKLACPPPVLDVLELLKLLLVALEVVDEELTVLLVELEFVAEELTVLLVELAEEFFSPSCGFVSQPRRKTVISKLTESNLFIGLNLLKYNSFEAYFKENEKEKILLCLIRTTFKEFLWCLMCKFFESPVEG